VQSFGVRCRAGQWATDQGATNHLLFYNIFIISKNLLIGCLKKDNKQPQLPSFPILNYILSTRVMLHMLSGYFDYPFCH
jgi:hypothetical protein